MKVTMEELVNYCKQYGFIFQGSEIYNGLANSWDYGPVGTNLKENIRKAWKKKFIQENPYNVGLDAAIIMNPKVWVASGHVASFADPLIDCKKCKARHRADKLIEDFTNRDDALIKDSVLSINRLLDLKYDKEDYLANYVNNFYSDEYVNKCFDEYFKYVKSLAESLENMVLEIESHMDSSSYQKLYDSVSNLFSPHNFNDLYKYKDCTLGKFTKLDEEGKALKENIQETFKTLSDLIFYSEEELRSAYLSTRKYVEIIIEIIHKLDAKINAFKKEFDAYEFTDIAKMAIKLVEENEIIREELKLKFNEIMIDEYQDTSDLQENFIKYIENDNVYMVGDIKQSIYRFRNANPLIFKNKYDKYSNHDGGIKIDLLKNFRSREEVLFNINEIFARLMTKELGGINYKESHAMIFGNEAYVTLGANNNNNYMDIYTYNNEDKKYSNDEIEAFIIANDINRKVKRIGLWRKLLKLRI